MTSLRNLLAVTMVGGVLAGASPLVLAAPPAGAAQTEVPVTSVALYSSGVGYFEHAGTVSGEAATELRFKSEQINDILKSLVLQDLDGGQVGTVVYPAYDPLYKTLRSFQVNIVGNPTLSDLLIQLRGAAVAVQFGGEQLRGSVVGVEPRRTTIPGSEEVLESYVLNLLTDGAIRALPLGEVQGIRLEDPQLQAELTKALAAVAQDRDQDKRPVTIHFDGQGERRVRIGYVVEAPVWKTSYRLVLADAGSPSVLQGWAIVENQTDNDWNGVRLSLVSGRPISFVEDLYQPFYIQRPVVEPERYTSVQPQTYGAGAVAEAERGVMWPEEADSARMKSMPAMAPRMLAAPAPAPALDPLASVSARAATGDLGQLFQYTVANVSLPRQRSAMIPIVSDPVTVAPLSIYNETVLQSHPLNGVRLTNTTGKHLLQGPVTVFEAGAYAGDARIDDLPAGQQRLLSFGVDLGVTVDAAAGDDGSTIQSGRIVKGVLQLTRKQVRTRDYRIENKGEKERTVLVEHPRLGGWELAGAAKPVETTDQLYRFELAVPAGKSGQLSVSQERVQGETIAILPADIGQIEIYSRTGAIPEAVRSVLTKAMEHKRAMVETQRQIDERRRQVAEITGEQERIRANMGSVSRNSDYYTRLLTKLNDQETRLEKLQTEIDTLTGKLAEQRNALERYLSGINVG